MIDIDRTDRGRIAVDEAVLTRLVQRTAEGVEGVHAVRARRGIRVVVEPGRAVVVSVGVVASVGTVLPDLGRSVQGRVAEAITAALEPSAMRVDMPIEEIAA